MDRFIHQLIRIENDADRIIEQTDEQKQQLAAEYEQRKLDYEKELDTQTAETLKNLSTDLAQKREKDIHALHMQTQDTIVALNKEFGEHGTQLAADMVQRILNA